jgi:hypothetical protein
MFADDESLPPRMTKIHVHAAPETE